MIAPQPQQDAVHALLAGLHPCWEVGEDWALYQQC